MSLENRRASHRYGLEKLYAEEMGIVYGRDFGIKFRCARFHNVYGPRGTWKGGREKAPAAFCRKAVCATSEFEMWGDGKQTRSFMFIDDCVTGIQKIMDSDCEQPLNLGSDARRGEPPSVLPRGDVPRIAGAAALRSFRGGSRRRRGRIFRGL